MSRFVQIVRVKDPVQVRVLLVALKAHGFHPLEGNAVGVPGMPGVPGLRGIPVEVPEEESEDARILAEALIADFIK